MKKTDTSWKIILDKIMHLEAGLLRFQDKNQRTALQVRATESLTPSSIQFALTDGDLKKRLVNHPGSLTQKYDNGYLYITGLVSGITQDDKQVISMNVEKAHWFVRKGTGSESWLEQAGIYERMGTEWKMVS